MKFLSECLTGLVILVISVVEIFPMGTQLRCFWNVGHTPSINQLMEKTRNFSIQRSAFECGALCKISPCLSFAYNPVTKQCFVSNVTVEDSGMFCGYTVEKARKKCAIPGESYTAFGGANANPMQCICGGKRPPNSLASYNQWTVYKNMSDVACIDICGNSSCVAKIGNVDSCTVCLGDNNLCMAERQPNITANVNMSICTQADVPL